MAVSVADLAVGLRLSADGVGLPTAQENILTRLLGVAEAHVTLLAAGAPEAVQDEAIIRMAGYLYDTPSAGRRDSYANSFVNSGAGALLTFWTPRAFANSTGTIAGGLIPAGVDDAAVLALIEAWAHVGNTDQIPANRLQNAGGAAQDDVARQAAATAQAEITAHESMHPSGAPALLVATVDVTNAQIKNLDTNYIELLAAPAASEYIKVDQIWFHKFGADAPTITSSSPTPNAASLNHYTNYILAMLITNPAATLPLGGDRTDYIWVYGSDLQQGGELLRAQPYLDGASVGGHGFAEGTALVLGLVASPARYSAAAWDEFIASANDVIMRISVFYSVHSRPVV